MVFVLFAYVVFVPTTPVWLYVSDTGFLLMPQEVMTTHVDPQRKAALRVHCLVFVLVASLATGFLLLFAVVRREETCVHMAAQVTPRTKFFPLFYVLRVFG